MNIPFSKSSTPPTTVMVRVERETPPTSIGTLVLADRCDHCGAQAFGSAQLPNAAHPLLFCAHHFTRYETKLRELGAKMVDERHRVLENEQARKRDGVSPD